MRLHRHGVIIRRAHGKHLGTPCASRILWANPIRRSKEPIDTVEGDIQQHLTLVPGQRSVSSAGVGAISLV